MRATSINGAIGSGFSMQATPPATKIGTFDTELVREFFQSLATHGGITLHVDMLHGINSHHIAEAAFKAVARALRDALEPDPQCLLVAEQARLLQLAHRLAGLACRFGNLGSRRNVAFRGCLLGLLLDLLDLLLRLFRLTPGVLPYQNHSGFFRNRARHLRARFFQHCFGILP